MEVGGPTEVAPSPAKTTQKSTDQLRMLLAGWLSPWLRPASAEGVSSRSPTTGETSVSHRSTDDEVAARVDVVHSVVIEVSMWDGCLDDLLHNLCLQVIKRHLL